MSNIGFDLDKIRFRADPKSFEKAIKIYESGGVLDFKETPWGFEAKVAGQQEDHYEVFVYRENYEIGECNCYLGQRDILCKHMIAVAIYALKRGKKLTKEEKSVDFAPKFSGEVRELTPSEIKKVKSEIRAALRYIKPYKGPSKIWFSYQDSLTEGCNRLASIVSKLPAGKASADILINLLLRLDKKLSYSGVDDSNGTVGDFIAQIVEVLKEYAKANPNCLKSFKKLLNRSTCFGWETPLIDLLISKSKNSG